MVNTLVNHTSGDNNNTLMYSSSYHGYTLAFCHFGADFNGWFLTIHTDCQKFEAELKIICVQFRNFSILVQLISSTEWLFFTEIPPRPRNCQGSYQTLGV